jgi:hypothetical protein
MEAAPVRASAAHPCSVPPQGKSCGASIELILGRQVPTLARRSPDHISLPGATVAGPEIRLLDNDRVSLLPLAKVRAAR